MTDLKASSLRALKLMDLTTLNDDDTDEKVIALCHQAKTPVGNRITSGSIKPGTPIASIYCWVPA